MAVATALAAGANGLSVVGTLAAGRAAKKKAEFEAGVAEQQGARARLVAQANERDFRRDISRRVASARAGIAGAGGELSGSSLRSLQDFVAEAEVGALRIREGGVFQQRRLTQQASLLRASGKSAERQSFLRAGSTLLQGFSGTNFGGGGGGVDTTQQFSSFSPNAPSNQ